MGYAASMSANPLAGKKILLGVSGGIAAYKAVFLARLFIQAGATVQVVMTKGATQFVGPLTSLIPFYNERHLIKPGLTGWAQINFPYGASVGHARRKLQLDL